MLKQIFQRGNLPIGWAVWWRVSVYSLVFLMPLILCGAAALYGSGLSGERAKEIWNLFDGFLTLPSFFLAALFADQAAKKSPSEN